MTAEEEQTLSAYLTHLNILGPDGDNADFEQW